MALISASDFTGIYKITQQTFTTDELTAYISQRVADYLIPLFGAELYALFIADLNVGGTAPTSARFLAVFNAFVESTSNGQGWETFHLAGGGYNPIFPCAEEFRNTPKYAQSYGIKDMLTGFVYFDFCMDQDLKASPSGMVQTGQDTATKAPASAKSQRLQKAYNRAIQSYRAIHWYMSRSEHDTDYPEYDGSGKEKIFLGGAV